MAAKIKEGPREKIQHTELEEFLKSSFLKPQSRTAATALGLANENNVRRAIPEFLKGSKVVELQDGDNIIEPGLAGRIEKAKFVTSIDGVVTKASIYNPDSSFSSSEEAGSHGSISSGDEESFTHHPLGFEIKTMAVETMEYATLVTRNQLCGPIRRCMFGDEMFHSIEKSGYRVQVLHHACVL